MLELQVRTLGYAPQWKYRQPMMIELCFNLLLRNSSITTGYADLENKYFSSFDDDDGGGSDDDDDDDDDDHHHHYHYYYHYYYYYCL